MNILSDRQVSLALAKSWIVAGGFAPAVQTHIRKQPIDSETGVDLSDIQPGLNPGRGLNNPEPRRKDVAALNGGRKVQGR
jgi:hypothetical protein